MSQTQPLVSIIMPVYNGQAYLREAIDSLLAQTYSNFEFLILNDGSTDQSEQIILSYTDPRIRYIKNEKNKGLTPTLNIGLAQARGTYIARQDCDDMSTSDRLEKQVQFLESNPDYAVVASLVALIDEHRQVRKVGGIQILDNEDLQWSLFFSNIFMHGECMFRKQLLDANHIQYNPDYTLCEDYKLWVDLSKTGKLKMLPDILYYYMVNSAGMSGTRWNEMQRWMKKVALEVRQTRPFPPLTLQILSDLYIKGTKLRDTTVVFDGVSIVKQLQQSYQIYIVRLGKMLIMEYGNPLGLLLFAISLCINPLNWIRLIYRVITSLGYTRIRLQ